MKNQKVLTGSINLILRGLSLAGKFLLVMVIAQHLSTADLGLYGLFATTVGIIVSIIAFEYNNFSTREIIKAPKNNRLHLIRDQIVFHILFFMLCAPFTYLIFSNNILPVRYFSLFLVLVFLENISNQLYLAFIALSKVLIANIILFIRIGLWAYVIMAIWQFWSSPELVTLDFIWYAWIVGVFISIIISVIILFKLKLGSVKDIKVNWNWIYQGIKVSFTFFLVVIAGKIVQFGNRYIIDLFMGKADVGVYIFFSNTAQILDIVVFTIVLSVYYPKLIEYAEDPDKRNFINTVRKFSKQIIIVSVISAIILVISINPILSVVKNKDLSGQMILFYILIASSIMANISYIPHYVLYAYKFDKEILYSTIIGAIVTLGSNFILIGKFGIVGAAIATIVSYFALFAIKSIFLYKNSKKLYLQKL